MQEDLAVLQIVPRLGAHCLCSQLVNGSGICLLPTAIHTFVLAANLCLACPSIGIEDQGDTKTVLTCVQLVAAAVAPASAC